MLFWKSFMGYLCKYVFFPLWQAVWRKIQSLGLTSAYLESLVAHTALKNLCSLAFPRHKEVLDGFEQLEDAAEDIRCLHLFEDTYNTIGRPHRRGSRRNAVFAPNLWSVRQRTKDGILRTDKKLEGWHRATLTLVDGCHPSVWRFFSAYKRRRVYRMPI